MSNENEQDGASSMPSTEWTPAGISQLFQLARSKERTQELELEHRGVCFSEIGLHRQCVQHVFIAARDSETRDRWQRAGSP